MNKRYSIVRVEECNEERLKLCPNMPTCAFCLYGDTKEQLIRKVAQILFRNAPKETYQPKCVEQREKIFKIAKEIVEFLGVEE